MKITCSAHEISMCFQRVAEMCSENVRVVEQKKEAKNKLYSLHSPETYCISKGKRRTPYEYGQKVSLVITHKQGVVLAAQTWMENVHDSKMCTSPIRI